MAEKKNEPVTMQGVHVGYAIRGVNGGYYDCNGIGDTSCAGDALTCEVFDSVEQALDAVEGEDFDDSYDLYEIVTINRVALATVSMLGNVEALIAERAEEVG